MSQNITISKESYEYLTRQLAELDEQKLTLFNDFFAAYAPGSPEDDRAETGFFLDRYISYVQDLLAGARVVDDDDTPPPVTLLGCDIKAREVDTGRTEVFRVVSPYHTELATGRISFLSPVGRNLLLKEPGDVLEVKAPGGTFRYQIISIDYPAQ
ncbi:MAG: GreA/GreB family elongation factor [Candidatus Desulforudis sp.]|nr:GreA/GreB family elongation factor [Desulforudis sp.]